MCLKIFCSELNIFNSFSESPKCKEKVSTLHQYLVSAKFAKYFMCKTRIQYFVRAPTSPYILQQSTLCCRYLLYSTSICCISGNLAYFNSADLTSMYSLRSTVKLFSFFCKASSSYNLVAISLCCKIDEKKAYLIDEKLT